MSTSSGSGGRKPTPTSSTTSKGKAPKPVSIEEELDTDGNTPMDPRPREQAGGIPPPYTGDARIQALENQLRVLTTQLATQQGERIQERQEFVNRMNQLRDGMAQGNRDGTVRTRDVGEIMKPTLPGKYNGDINCKRFLLDLREYFSYYPNGMSADSTKVKFAIGRLEGRAYKHFEKNQTEYLNLPSVDWSEQTERLYLNYEIFKERISKIYDLEDDKDIAIRELNNLQMDHGRTAMTKYIADHTTITGRLN